MSEEKLRALLAEARSYVKSVAPCSDTFPCGHYRCELLNSIDAALAEPAVDHYRRGAEAMREAIVRYAHDDCGFHAMGGSIKDIPVPEDKP